MAYGGFMGGGGYGYGAGFAPTPGGFTPARTGAVESSPATPFEKVSGKLDRQESSVRGSVWGGGIGGAGGAAAGAAVGSRFAGKAGAAVGGVIGAVGGIVGGVFAGKEINKGRSALKDTSDDGKFNGSRREEFQMDRTYNSVF
ncbi:hypothetical protein [Vampirovibrio sp.]|uniref:hypothetical protein n=1 Tax=Vampirovibrio sp. TaxID=2717857 RepID=UPI00359491CD